MIKDLFVVVVKRQKPLQYRKGFVISVQYRAHATGTAMRTSTMAPYWMIGQPLAISTASS